MHQANNKDYWDIFFSQKSSSLKEITRNDVLLSIFCDDIETKYLIPENMTTLLEVGCGQAFFSIIMSLKGYKTYCIDFSFKALTMAKESFDRENIGGYFIAGDATALPIQSGTIDIIYCAGLLDIFERPSIPLQEMARVLKTRGIILAAIPNRKFSIQKIADGYNCFVNIIKTLIGKPSPQWKMYRNNLKHARNYSKIYYENEFNNAGFDLLHSTSGYPIPELSLPAPLKRSYIRWLVKKRRTWLQDMIFSKNPLRTSLGIYYYIFARKR